jgi:uncharacterized protein
MLPGLFLYLASITVATFIHGYGGFGFGYISVAIFALLPLPMSTAVNVLTLVSFPVAIVLALMDGRRNPVDWRIVGLLTIGIVFGTPAGYWFVLSYGQTRSFRIAFGALLIVFGFYNQFVSHGQYRIGRGWGPLFGLAGGFLGGAIVSGGPPMVVFTYGQSEDPRTKKGTLQVTFLIASIVRTLLIGFTPGAFDTPLIVTAAMVSVPVVGAMAMGHRLSIRSSPGTFRNIVNVVLLGFGVYLVVSALRG